MERNLHDLSQNDFYEVKSRTSLCDIFKSFIKFRLHGVRNAEATVNDYQHTFGLLLKFNPELTIADLTEETIINFLEFLNTRKRKVGKQLIVRVYKNSSIAVIRSRLNPFFEWLIERNYLDINPLKKIPYPKITYTDRRAFSPKEFELICFVVNTKIQWNSLFVKKRNVAIIMFLTLTGVRKGELLGLKLSNIETSRRLITIPGDISKSKITRIIPMNPQLVPYLEDYLDCRKHYASQSLWASSTVDRPFTEHGAKHLIDLITKETKINCHLHRFRHTFAINYYRQTHDLVGLKKLMGHQSLKMTISYLRSLPDEHIVEQIQKMTLSEFV